MKNIFLNRLLKNRFFKIMYYGQPYFMPERALMPPETLMIEPTNVCDQHCPTCPTGSGKSKRIKRSMSFEEFRMIIDQAKKFIKHIMLYNYGEPFLNKDIYKMVKYATGFSIYVSTSTNGAFLNGINYKEHIEKILASNLNELNICLDGMDQQTIDKFRDNISIENLKKRIEELIKIKNRTEKKLPIIIIQFILMRHNAHQIKEVRKFAEDIGADYFYEKSCGIDVNDPNFHSLAERLLPDDMQFSSYRRYYRDFDGKIKFKERKMRNRCSWIYGKMVINSDGAVVPCCYDLYNEIILGNAFKEKLIDIWNGECYRGFRKRIKKERNSIRICNRCDEFYHYGPNSHGKLIQIKP